MVPISVSYEGSLRCVAIHGPSGTRLITDAPADNHGKGESFSPTDLMATALATCMATTIGIKAMQKGVDVTGIAVRVEKHMSTDSPRRIAALPVHIEMPIPEDHPDAPVLKAAALGCPVHHSLASGIDRPVTFVWRG